jgi:gliding motility-associated-like protein/uncharacterized repeat protein (TIGR01451 family)
MAGNSLFAQEAFAPEQLYFQGEVIRKVSVGADGIWVIKGEDSTGVAMVDFQGVVKDYNTTLGINQPLTNIIGGYGESAIMSSRLHSLYSLQNGAISTIDQNKGFDATKINALYGTPEHTRVATEKGIYHTYDNKIYHIVEGTAGKEFVSVSANELHYTDVEKSNTFHFKPTPADEFYELRHPLFDSWRSIFFNPPLSKTHAYLATDTYNSFTLELLMGGEYGLYVNTKMEVIGSTGSSKERLFTFLQDTTVYTLKKYKHFFLTGTTKGLYYYTTKTHAPYDGKITKVELNSDYIIYDIAVQEAEQTIWLATNKGLLKLSDRYKIINNYQNRSLLWAKSFDGPGTEKVNTIITDAQGNTYQTGYFSGRIQFGDVLQTAQNHKDFSLIKRNAEGEILWIRTAENTSLNGNYLYEQGIRLTADSQGNTYVICHLVNPGSTANYNFGNGKNLQNRSSKLNILLKYSPDGNLLMLKELTTVQDCRSLSLGVSDQDHLYISGITVKNAADGRFVIKLDADGNELWSKQFPASLDKFNIGKQGKFYLSGYFRNALTVGSVSLQSDVLENLAVIQFDEAGEPLWSKIIKNFESWDGRFFREIEADSQGNTFIGGEIKGKPIFGEFSFDRIYSDAYFLTKINNAGEFEWLRYSGGTYGTALRDLVVDAVGNSYITGECYNYWMNFGEYILKPETNKSRKIYIAKFDTQGNNHWVHALPEINFTVYESKGKVLSINSKGVLLNADLINDVRINSMVHTRGESYSSLLVQISDTFIETPFNIIKGRSYNDKNGNKQFDEGELGIDQNIIKIEPGPYYADVDYSGNFQIKLDTGTYTIEQIIPKYPDKKVTQTHPATAYVVKLNEYGIEETGYDFANQVVRLGQQGLSIDISADVRRRCFDSKTVVYLNNLSDNSAENVDVMVEYPEHIIPKSSSYPWSKKDGKKLTFTFPRIEANSSLWIIISDSVKCGDETIRGLEQCVKAFLAPADTTVISPDWDRSDVELTATCKDNGFVRVALKNTGTGQMTDSAAFNIYLDQVLIFTGKYKLASGESLSLNLLANGKPLLFEASLTPHHPLKKSVSIHVEGCNTTAPPIITGSMVHNFPLDTRRENKKVVCLEIIDSYDPNDKKVVPAGITSNHNIRGDEYLEYTIRFQNTGTASAINIKITDELDQYLDVATLKIGASSHPVVWEKTTGPTTSIIWRFNKIYLPDSTTNEPASHGFVKFRIKPKQGLHKGTVIRNKADIYFDFNSPITTNQVFNSIGLPVLVAGAKVVIQACNTRVTLQEEQNDEVVLCGGVSSYQLSRQLPINGRGMWKVTKGTAELTDPFSHETLATNLSFGENEFSWIVTYCDQVVSSKVTVIREQPLEKPQVKHPAYICQGEVYPAITATGEGVEWYRDEALTQLALKGNTYQPSGQASETLYVIQRNEHCSSPATIVPVMVHQQPLPPVAPPVEACVEVAPPVLTAQGSHLRWYADATKQQLLAEGESFSPADKSSRTYWLTQSSEYCESGAVEVSFTAKHFDPAKAYIANVVTPNGDGKNQLYYVKDFEGKECMGEFISIKIYNRWGKQVYESKAADFRWDASSLPVGVYYYRMDYQLNKFQGAIQVLR